MLIRMHRLAYRVAAPVAQVGWAVLGTRHDGVKCVICRAGQVLLVRHTYGDRRRWDLPGGFIRRREEPAAAARREIGEELGLVVDAGDVHDLGAPSTRVGRRRSTVYHFLIELAGQAVERNAVELSQIAWFHPDGLPPRLGEGVRELVGRIGTAPGGAPPAAGAGTSCVSIGLDQSGESRGG